MVRSPLIEIRDTDLSRDILLNVVSYLAAFHPAHNLRLHNHRVLLHVTLTEHRGFYNMTHRALLALLAPAAPRPMLAKAAPATILALVAPPPMLANAAAAALLAHVALPPVLANAAAAALLALVAMPSMLANAAAAALFAEALGTTMFTSFVAPHWNLRKPDLAAAGGVASSNNTFILCGGHGHVRLLR